jgi:hypothetical protein
MSQAPKNRRLANRVRDWSRENYTGDTEQVVFLGSRGEVRNVRHPSQGDADSLLTERDDLLKAGLLGAVVYLSPAPYTWTPIRFSIAEFYDGNGQRTVHQLTAQPGQYRWSESSTEFLDIWLDQFREEDNRSTQQ